MAPKVKNIFVLSFNEMSKISLHIFEERQILEL